MKPALSTSLFGAGILSLAMLDLGVCFSPEEGAGGGTGDAATPPAKTYTEAEYNALVAERNTLKSEHDTVKTKLTAFEQSQLTEQQKTEQRAADADQKRKDAETARDTQAAELKQERLERLVERTAGELHIVDADAALRLLDQSKIEYDGAGKPKNVKELLTQLATDKPYLVAQGSSASVGLTPGAARTGRGGQQTAEDVINADFAKAHGNRSPMRLA